MAVHSSDNVNDDGNNHDERKALQNQVGSLIGNWTVHELDSVLTATLIQSLLALIKLPAQACAHPHIVNVNKGVECASLLAQQLLFYVQGPAMKLEPLDPNELCKECAELWRAWAPPELHLHLDLSPETPFVYGDHYRLRQVLVNLMVNATGAVTTASFSGQERNTIELRTRTRVIPKTEAMAFAGNDCLPPGEYACLSVKDRGPSLRRETVASLFEPNFDAEVRGRKCGLGLSLQIVRKHRGGLQIQSELQQGSTCKVYLPAHSHEEEAGARQCYKQRPVTLIPDDKPGIRHAVADLLELINLETRTLANGADVVSHFAAEQKQIELILLDVDADTLLPQTQQLSVLPNHALPSASSVREQKGGL